MTQHHLKDVWDVTKIVAVAVALILSTFAILIGVSGRLALSDEESRIVVRQGVDRVLTGPTNVEQASGWADPEAGNPDQRSGAASRPATF
jgi:hypothetical protein